MFKQSLTEMSAIGIFLNAFFYLDEQVEKKKHQNCHAV